MGVTRAFRCVCRAVVVVLAVCGFSMSSADERDLIKLSHDPYTDLDAVSLIADLGGGWSDSQLHAP
jgi:hypothetical protein